MGRQHRVTKVGRAFAACAACALALSLAAVGGCSDPVDQKAQMRRDVLRANDLAAERKQRFEAVRTTDDHGNLIASDQRVAGVVLPRGYSPKFTFDQEWYFDGEHSYNKLARYFTDQLDFSNVQRPNNATLTFLQARTKGDAQMKPVSLTISPVPGRDDWSRIRIVGRQPLPERRQSFAEIEAELAKRRQNMH